MRTLMAALAAGMAAAGGSVASAQNAEDALTVTLHVTKSRGHLTQGAGRGRSVCDGHLPCRRYPDGMDIAYTFADRIGQKAWQYLATFERALGHAMAHEVGHAARTRCGPFESSTSIASPRMPRPRRRTV